MATVTAGNLTNASAVFVPTNLLTEKPKTVPNTPTAGTTSVTPATVSK